jgi:hypothetical protein
MPISYGFDLKTSPYITLSGITGSFGLAGSLALNRRKRGDYGHDEAVRDLIYIVLVSLSFALSFVAYGVTISFAMGLFRAGTSGKLHPSDPLYLNRRYLVTVMGVFLVIGIITTVWLHETPSIEALIKGAIVPPAVFLSGQFVGLLMHRCVPPLVHVWHELKQLGRLLGGYTLGYLLITVVFAGCYASLYRVENNAFKGVSGEFGFVDYWYYSFAVMATIIDANPTTKLAKAIVALEVLTGIAWTVVVFAALLNSAQRLFNKLSVDNSAPKPETSTKPGGPGD